MLTFTYLVIEETRNEMQLLMSSASGTVAPLSVRSIWELRIVYLPGHERHFTLVVTFDFKSISRFLVSEFACDLES